MDCDVFEEGAIILAPEIIEIRLPVGLIEPSPTD